MFRVTLVNLTERIKDSWEYSSLLDALKVAKNVDTSTRDDLMARPAMTDEFFNTNLIKLLTLGFLYIRDDVLIELRKVDENGKEQNIFAYSVAHLPVDKPFIPSQFTSPVGESNIIRGED